MTKLRTPERRYTLPEVVGIGFVLAMVLVGVTTAATTLFGISSGQVAAVVSSAGDVSAQQDRQ